MTCPQIDTLIDLNCKVYVKNKNIFVMQFHYCIMLCVRNLCIPVQKVVHGDIHYVVTVNRSTLYPPEKPQCDNPNC